MRAGWTRYMTRYGHSIASRSDGSIRSGTWRPDCGKAPSWGAADQHPRDEAIGVDRGVLGDVVADRSQLREGGAKARRA